MATLRVCLHAHVAGGVGGGVQQVVIGVARGLAALDDGDERYEFLVWDEDAEWLAPHVGPPCAIRRGGPRPLPTPWPNWLRRLPGARAAWSRLLPAIGLRRPPPLAADPALDAVGADVVHFLTQNGARTATPSVYSPYDLLHLHFPRQFANWDRRVREARYRALCAQASRVTAMTTWVRDDLVRRYGLPPAKLQIVPMASVLPAYGTPSPEEVADVRRRFALPDAFAWYPAQTWPHKNHLRLMDALARLRDRDGLVVPLVCTGHRSEHHAVIARRIERLGLAAQIRFLGFVSESEVRALYAAARMLVFPSEFEGWGLPVSEAFDSGLPVASCNVTSLPALAGNAARLFDPTDVAAIAAAVRDVWTDDELRATLVAAGRQRAAQFSWERTARLQRAVYRALVGRATDADRELLAAPPLV